MVRTGQTGFTGAYRSYDFVKCCETLDNEESMSFPTEFVNPLMDASNLDIQGGRESALSKDEVEGLVLCNGVL